DIFDRIAKVEVKERRPILGVQHDFFYRNKLEFSFSNKLWIPREDMDKGINQDRNVLGFHVPKVFDKLIDIEECYLQVPLVSQILNEMRDFSIEKNITCYDFKEHTGFLRNLMFRSSAATGELMLTLIVAKDDKQLIAEIFSHLQSKFPEIQHFIWIVNTKLNSSFSDLPFHVWEGLPYITERLGNFQYQISPTSFFQTNPTQADTLYSVAKEMLQSTLKEGQEKHQIVYDLYTGTGSIAIYVSDLAEKIVGIEYVESSIIDAKKNCQINDIQHINFYAGDMAKVLTEDLVKKEGAPSVIITDPPRAGMAKKVIVQILKTLPEHIIYISCHPATQARDVDMMRDFYDVIAIQPVDMFPQTAHVENVCLLKKKDQIAVNEVEIALQKFEEKGMEALGEMLEE
ncbi:MAG: 23S rRNA (uracil(1939)-C(5))-methyltransferase RlmD, partial [Bacteroidia bacterium]